MRLAIFGAFVLFALWCGDASADVTGDFLKENCDAAQDTAKFMYCAGYISGALDSLRVMEKKSGKKLYCEPSGVTGQQLVAMTQKILDDHPEMLNYGAASIIMSMMVVDYPCPKNSK